MMKPHEKNVYSGYCPMINSKKRKGMVKWRVMTNKGKAGFFIINESQSALSCTKYFVEVLQLL